MNIDGGPLKRIPIGTLLYVEGGGLFPGGGCFSTEKYEICLIRNGNRGNMAQNLSINMW